MKISIIIPYSTNRGWLNKAIESIDTQRTEHEIDIIESQSPNGVCFNINKGFESVDADSDFVRFLSEDDELPPMSVQHSIDWFINNPDFDFFHSNAYTINASGMIVGEHIPRYTPKNARELAGKNYIHGGTVVYRRECFDAHKWDESLWTGEEYEYNMRLLHNGLKLGYNNAFTYRYRKHNQQKSARSNRNLTRRILAITEIKNKYKAL